MSDNQSIEYKRLVSCIAANLSAEEVERVAYIRLTDSQSVAKYLAREQGANALSLLFTLERLRVFSQQNVDGLLEIAKDVDRRDLIDKVEEYKAKRMERVKKKPQRLLHVDQQQRDKMIITKLAALQKHVSLLQRALKEENDTKDEAEVLLRTMEEILQNLTSKLQQPLHRQVTRPRSNSSSSSSTGSGGTSGGSTASSPADSTLTPTLQEKLTSGEAKDPKKKPVPKQRKRPPVQESAIPSTQLSLPLECQDKEPIGYVHSITSVKPQIHPRKIPVQSAPGNMNEPEISYQLPNRHAEDNTGDSGMGTGSDTGPYSSVEVWRQGISNPPPQRTRKPTPDSSEHTYQPIISENREPDALYKVIKRE